MGKAKGRKRGNVCGLDKYSKHFWEDVERMTQIEDCVIVVARAINEDQRKLNEGFNLRAETENAFASFANEDRNEMGENHSFILAFIDSLIYKFIHSFIHSFIPSLIYSWY